MNLFNIYLEEIKKTVFKKNTFFKLLKSDLVNVTLEKPPENYNYDFSTNIALILSKKLKLNPLEIAEKIKLLLSQKKNNFSQMQIDGPGFINININKNLG